jgi:hypothetical protein
VLVGEFAALRYAVIIGLMIFKYCIEGALVRYKKLKILSSNHFINSHLVVTLTMTDYPQIIICIFAIFLFSFSATIGINIALQILYEITDWFVFSPVFCDAACVVAIGVVIVLAYGLSKSLSSSSYDLLIFIGVVILVILIVGVIFSRGAAQVVLLVIKAWLRSI